MKKDHNRDGVGAAGPGRADTPAGSEPAAEPEQACFVVAIGASAGGQSALEQMFTTMPTDCGLAFLVVMHLPPTGPSFLAEMLGRYTSMEVLTAEEGMLLKPNRVHVIPAGWNMVVKGDRLHLEPSEVHHGAYHPIDRLFGSLAGQAGERAVAVVLSGSGSDGANGVKMIREAGGVVIVQEPVSADYPAMPRSAIATGVADLVLPAEEIPLRISEIARGTCPLSPRTCVVTTLDEDLAAIFSIVRGVTGHDFSSYKTNTVMRRIERRMAVNDAAGIGKYIVLLRDNAQEAHALCQDILIGVTSFFRDPDAFAVLRSEVIPSLMANRPADEPLRIWHACCATGEEVYSTAMLIKEYLGERKLDIPVLIFATDIDEVAINQARAGLYGDDIEEDVGAERLKAFFTRVDGRWQVAKSLREMVVFAHHSLIKDPPFSRLDLLVCRNFLIYLNPDTQKRLIALFHQVLKPGGVLFLGGSETVGRASDLFATMDKKWKIFRRLEGGRRPEALFPFATPVRRISATGRPPLLAEAVEPTPAAIVEKLLMERYSPPCVVVNEKYEIVHISTRSNRFLEVPVGEPTRDILRMAREELRPALRAAIYKVFAEQRQVAFRGVRVDDDDGETAVNVMVEPLDAPAAAGKLAMVVFEPVVAGVSPPLPCRDVASLGDDTSKDLLIRQLEEQLRITSGQLQATSEQLASSHEGFLSANEELVSINEEFQSANEELQSTNEELETSKEELQALNEELNTVNVELMGKVEELNQANTDMENLLTSSGIATIFLDRHLNIKGFTPAVAGIFNLIRSDMGRPFRHFAGKIDWPSFAQDAETVLAGLPFTEREVMSLDGERCYLKRLFPYRAGDGTVDGIVVTFIDITERKKREQQLADQARLLDLSCDAICIRDGQDRIIYWNASAVEIYGYTRDEGLGKVSHELLQTEFAEPLEAITEKLYRDGRWSGELVHTCKDGGRIIVDSRWALSRDAYGNPSILETNTDITARKQAEEALRESEAHVRLKLESILSPEGDIGNLELADIIDSQAIQSLMDDYYKLVPMPMAIIDLKGKVLVGKGWQNICTRFHRVHAETRENCIESDLQLTAGISAGEFRLYKCKNNMWDVATPIMVGDQHIGNLFSGQFFFDDEPLDYGLFRSQARRYGFNEAEYIAALECVPRLNREFLAAGMEYFIKFAGLISKLSYSNIKLARSLAEREALAASVRESEERLNRAQEIAHLGGWELDLVTKRLSWSEEVYRIFGLQPRESGASYEAFLETVHPDDRAAVDAAYSDSLREGRNSYEIEHRIVRPTSGEVRVVHEKCEHFRDETGRIIRSVGMVHDITERKQAGNALLESEERFRILSENSPDCVALHDRELRHLYVNPAVTQVIGLPLESFLGKTVWEVGMPPEAASQLDAMLRTALETGQDTSGDLVFPASDGPRYYIWRSVPIFAADGTVRAVLAIANDISERKRAEEALQQSVARLDLLAETASKLLMSDTPQEVVESLCHKVMAFLDCQAFFNFLVDEEQGRLYLNACAGISEEEAEKIQWLDYDVAVCGCAAQHGSPIVAEDIPATPDPRTDLVRSYGMQAYACHPLLAQGKVLGTLSFGTRTRTGFSSDDLSLMKAVADQVAIAMERKRAEETLRRAHDELDLRVRQRTEELAATVDTLRDEIGERERMEASLLQLNRLYAVLSEIDQAIVRATDRDVLFSDFCRIAAEQGGFLLAWVGIVDQESELVRRVAACGATGYLDGIRISAIEEPSGLGPTGMATRDGSYHICNDFQNDPSTLPWHERGVIHGIRSAASVALKEEGRVVGALTLYAGVKDFFDRQHVKLLVQMGADVSFALDNLAREARRRQAEDALREETLERLRAVESLRDKEQMLLQQSRLAAMGEMINNIAHQWRQPLNVLGLLVQQMRLFYDIGSFSKEYLDTSVNKSMDLINHMSQTIDDFRNFFKPDKEKVEFAIHEVVVKTVSLVEDGFKNQQIEIVCTASANPSITGFPNEYSQALLNILMNARDVLLDRCPKEPRVTVTISQEGERAVVAIGDNAGGIAEEIMDKIFEPYFTTKGPDRGTGVGLFMSKTIIEKNMSGRLTVRNTAEGAEFRIEV